MKSDQTLPVISYRSYLSPCGELLLGAVENRLCLCDWIARKNKEKIRQRLTRYLHADWKEEDSEILRQACCQLDEYFNGKRKIFEIPLLTAGTAFQQKVWNRLQHIPYGSTLSYSTLARQLQQPSAVRAVASANGANALSIFIPCHRIIGQNGQLAGYAGGLDAKQFLLELERYNTGLFSCPATNG